MLKILTRLELFLIFLSNIKTLTMLYLINEIPLTRILVPILAALIKYLPNKKNFMGKMSNSAHCSRLGFREVKLGDGSGYSHISATIKRHH